MAEAGKKPLRASAIIAALLYVGDAFSHIGLLVLRRGSALRVMRSELSNYSAGAEFVKKLDQREYDQIKALLLAAYAEGKPERLAKIEAAKTLADIQKVFIEIIDASKADSTDGIHLALRHSA